MKMLEKLFTSKNRVKIISFFLFESSHSHIREIGRTLKLPVSGVKKEVDNLLFLGILKNEKGVITLNNQCNYLEDLKKVFIKTDYIVYPLKEAFKNIDSDFIFIFGSFARGDIHEESDVDLMVVGNINLSSVIKILSPVEDYIKKNINPVVWTIKNLKKERKSSFIRDILKKGIITIKGDENEFRKIVE